MWLHSLREEGNDIKALKDDLHDIGKTEKEIEELLLAIGRKYLTEEGRELRERKIRAKHKTCSVM